MLIYAVADIHGKNDRLQTIRQAIETYHPDVLVIAGDITNYRDSVHTINQINTLPVPVLAIRGNTDRKKVDRLVERSTTISSLHLNEIIIKEISFIGISGTVPLPFRSRLCLKEQEYIETLEAMTKTESVLVVHPPPWGVLDEVFGRFHAGCRSLASLISRVQPRLVICGHIHEGRGTAAMENSIIVNCSIGYGGSGTLIKCHPDRIETTDFL